MDNTIVTYFDHVELYLHFRYKEKLEQVKWGKKFDWRKKCWKFIPNKHCDIAGIVKLIKDVFPEFQTLQGTEQIDPNPKRTIILDEDKILFHCSAYDDDYAKSAIASHKWDKKNSCWSFNLSMDNLWILKKSFENVELSTDPKTRLIYKKLVDEKNEYERITKELNHIKATSWHRTEYNKMIHPFEHQKVMFSYVTQAPETALIADCLLPNSKIKLNEKYINIEDVKALGKIETLLGESFVNTPTQRDYCGDIYKIQTCSGFFPISVTANHKFFVIRQKQCAVLTRGKNTVCSNRCNRHCKQQRYLEYKIESVPANQLTKHDSLLFRRPIELIGTQQESSAYLKLIGYYLTDGWIKKYNGLPCGIGIGFGIRQKNLALPELTKALDELKYNYSIKIKERRNVIFVYINSVEIAKKIFKDCGELAGTKHLPYWFRNLSNEQKIITLRAMIQCDAYVRLNYSIGQRTSQSIKYCTISYELATQFRDSLLSMGVKCSCTFEKGYEKNNCKHQDAYRIIIAREYMHLFGYDIPQIRHALKQTEHKEFGQIYTLLNITGIEKSNYSGMVYNLNANGHPSYLTDIGISQNCGTGKTYVMIHAINYRKLKGEINSALVICPLSIVNNAWKNDIEKFMTGNSYSVLWTNKVGEKRRQYIEEELSKKNDIYIINFDGARIYKDLLTQYGFDMVIVDESSKVKSSSSSVFKSIIEIAQNAKYRNILTATPAPNGPEDSWGQYYFMDRGKTLGSNEKDFAMKFFNRFDVKDKTNNMVFPQFTLKPRALEMLHEMIDKRSFRIRSEDCLDLPEQTFIDMKVEMTPKQRKHYEEMKEFLFTELDDGTVVEVTNAMVSLGKLRQITSGFVMTKDQDEPLEWLVNPDDNPKTLACDDLVEQITSNGRKVIIWAAYRAEIEMLTERYKHLGAVNYYGGTSANNKVEGIEKFCNDPKCKIMVAHAMSIGHGVTLVSANYAIYYSLDFNQDTFYQSTKRIHRPGQKEKCTYYSLLCPKTIDILIKGAIAKKTRIQDLLTDGRIRESIERLSEQTELSL